MAEEINFEVTGFGQLRQQLREAQLEMIKLAEAGKQGSAEFIKAAQKAGQLKETIKDAAESAQVFTTEGKFQAVTKSLAAVAGGFTAVQGAISLVSDDTKAFEATFKKLQAAMALTQGLTALADLGDAFKNLGTLAVGAFNSIKAAIGSTGIGLLIVGLGTAITALAMNFDKLVPKAKTLADELKTTEEELKSLSTATAKQTTNVNLLVDAVTDQNRSEKERREALKKLKDEYPNYFNNLTNDINDTKTLVSQKDKLIETLIREARVRASQDEIEKIAAKNIGQRMKLNEQLIKAQKDQTQAEREAGEVRFNANKNLKDYTLPTEEEWNKTIEAQPEAFEKSNKAFARRLQAQTKTAGIQAQINALNQQELKDSGVFLGIIQDETAAIQANGGASDVKTEKVTTNTKKEITAVRDANEAQRKLDEERATAGQDLITTTYANNLSRLKENQAEELKQKDLTGAQITEINAKYTKLIELNEQQRINAVAKYEKDALDKAEKDAADFEEKRKSSAKKEFEQRKGEIDKIYGEKKLAIEKEEISERDKKAKLDALELDRLSKQKTNAKDYVDTVDEAAEEVVDIELQTQQKLKSIEDQKKADRKATVDFALQSAAELSDALSQLSNARMSKELAAAKGNKEKEEEIKKEYFEKDKAYQYAKAVISGIQAGISAFAQGMAIGGPPLAGIFLGISAATTAIQLAAISQTEYVSSSSSGSSSDSAKSTPSTYEQGGLLMGRSHDLGGIRTAMGELEGGEFVINRRATANFLPLLESINSLGNTRGPEVSVAAQTPIVKTYVVATDMTSQQEANARLNALARL